MSKLWKRLIMLCTLIGCMATAAWAGNVEMDWIGGNTYYELVHPADGFYMTTSNDGDTVINSYFNDEGNVTWSTEKHGNQTWSNRYEYDENSHLVKHVMVYEEGGTRNMVTETFTYEHGILTESRETINYGVLNGSHGCNWLTFEDSEYYYEVSGHEMNVKKYYADSYKDRSYVGNTVYDLDNDANVIKYVSYNTDMEEVNTTTYSYDLKGNLISITEDDGDIYYFEYNDKDLCIKETHVYNDNSYSITYEYDENGNLIKSDTNTYTYAPIPQGGSKSSFKDVVATEYYNMPVIWATVTGVTAGIGDNQFAPNQGCTRAQLVSFLWRAAGEPEPETTNSPFTDVQNPSEYYYKAVLWAAENGIAAGVGNNQFAPNQTCTRAQIVSFIYRASGDKVTYTENPFKDISKEDYFYQAVLWGAANGVVAGTSDTTFSPNQTCTRAQGVSFLYRSVGLY